MFKMILLVVFSFFIYSNCEYIEGQSNELELFKNEMRFEMSNLKMEMMKLKNENHLFQRENEKLKILVRNTEKGNSALGTKVFNIEKENINLKNIVESMLVDGRMLVNGSGANFEFPAKSNFGFNRTWRSDRVDRNLPTWEVTFHAKLLRNIPLSDNEVIRFDKVLTNLANAYDGSSGTFQAPTPGYYVLYAHLLTMPHKSVEAFMMQNEATILHLRAGSDSYDSGSNMVVVYLKSGDRVWVKAHEERVSSGNVLDELWTTFSGFLLYSDL